MNRIILIVLGLFLFGSTYAQNGTHKRYPFKKAIITYNLTGDYQGTKTVYIDNYGEQEASYWAGKYEKRQAGPNEIIDFKFHDIFTNKLKYQINDQSYSALVSANPNILFYPKTTDLQKVRDSILKGESYINVNQTELINGIQCSKFKITINFIIKVDNYLWINDKNIVYKADYWFLPQLQAYGSHCIVSLKSIDYDAEIPDGIFSDFPKHYLYQFVKTTNTVGEYLDDELINDDERKSIEEKLLKMSFLPTRDINKETFEKNVQAFSNSYVKDEQILTDFDDNNGYINCQFSILESTDTNTTSTVAVVVDIRNREDLDRLYLDDYKRSFNDFSTIEHKSFNLDGKKAIYIRGVKSRNDIEQEALSIIILNSNNKYRIKFEVYGVYSQDEMIEMLKKLKILDL